MDAVTLTTERLTLRAPTAADADAITAACQDPEIPRWTTVPSPYSRDDAVAFVGMIAEGWADVKGATWGVFADDRLAGVIGIDGITENVGGNHAELGYWMAPEARGKGYLVEAARAVIEWSFAELGLVRIQWQAVAGNIPSARAARALGFRYEGLRRQALTGPRGRDDGWTAGLLATDDRIPVAWPIPLD